LKPVRIRALPALSKRERKKELFTDLNARIKIHSQTKVCATNSSFAFTTNDSYDARVTLFKTIIKPEARIVKMKFPGGLNIQGMMKQAQQMQEKMAREMEELRVDASAGGGVVNVTMKGDHEIISLKIDPEIVKENDIEMLQDMVVAAINEGNRKVNEAMKGKLGSMLPPGLGNLF
jgi:DNA-binding YbaB/EbfC family protein